MKIAGILADNYKLEKFEKELNLNGFTNITYEPFTPLTTTIKITVEDNQLRDIKRICQYVEIYFKQRN